MFNQLSHSSAKWRKCLWFILIWPCAACRQTIENFIPTASRNCLFLNLQGNHLRCRNSAELKSVYLPLGDQSNNYSLSVVVTVKNEHETATTAVHTQVCYLPVLMYLRQRLRIRETGKIRFWITLTASDCQGVEKQLPYLCEGSPFCSGWYCESVRAAGSAHWWSSRANIYISFWYAECRGRPRAEGCKDGGSVMICEA